MELIQRWLKGNRNFIVGKNLYASFGADGALKKLFDQGETVFSKQKLISALEAVLTTPAPAAIQTSPEPLKIMPESTDSVLQSIQNGWKEKYSKMNLLRHQLEEFGERNDWEALAKCKTICKEILELEQEVNHLWGQRDEYLAKGKLPGMPESDFVIPDNPVEIGKLIEAVKKGIRRNKKKALENPTNPVYAALVKEYQEKLEKINKKI